MTIREEFGILLLHVRCANEERFLMNFWLVKDKDDRVFAIQFHQHVYEQHLCAQIPKDSPSSIVCMPPSLYP